MKYLLYHSLGKRKREEIKQEYTIKESSVFKNNRAYFTKIDYVWSLITWGKYKKVVVLDEENAVVHTTCVIGKCFKFPFLSRTSAEIGPCQTREDFRGRGIYPTVLNYVLCSGEYQEYYMLVAESNLASVRGIEKAGFQRIGSIAQHRMRWIRQ